MKTNSREQPKGNTGLITKAEDDDDDKLNNSTSTSLFVYLTVLY